MLAMWTLLYMKELQKIYLCDHFLKLYLHITAKSIQNPQSSWDFVCRCQQAVPDYRANVSVKTACTLLKPQFIYLFFKC